LIALQASGVGVWDVDVRKGCDLLKPGGRVALPNGVEPVPKRRRRKISIVSYDADDNPRLYSRLERGGVLGRIVLRIK
jgi:hypothetical protein